MLKTTNNFKNKSCLVQLLMSEVQLRGKLISILTETGNTGCHIPHLIANSKLPQPERKQRQDFWNLSLKQKKKHTHENRLWLLFMVKPEINHLVPICHAYHLRKGFVIRQDSNLGSTTYSVTWTWDSISESVSWPLKKTQGCISIGICSEVGENLAYSWHSSPTPIRK